MQRVSQINHSTLNLLDTIYKLVNHLNDKPKLTGNRPPLCLFKRYFNCDCSQVLTNVVPPPAILDRPSLLSAKSHPFTLYISTISFTMSFGKVIVLIGLKLMERSCWDFYSELASISLLPICHNIILKSNMTCIRILFRALQHQLYSRSKGSAPLEYVL